MKNKRFLSKEELSNVIIKHMELKEFGDIIKSIKNEIVSMGYSFDGKLTSQIVIEFQGSNKG